MFELRSRRKNETATELFFREHGSVSSYGFYSFLHIKEPQGGWEMKDI